MKGGSDEEGAWSERSREEESNAPSHPATKATSERPRHTRKTRKKKRRRGSGKEKQETDRGHPASEPARGRRKIENR